MQRFVQTAVLASTCLWSSTTFASSPSAYSALDRASGTACIKASGLREARVGEPIRFSDRLLIDGRVVTGIYPQPHMKGSKATMLCGYNRRTKIAETQEMPAPEAINADATLKDIWWTATDIAGEAVIARSPVTMMLGSDGKIVGKSGCNNYSLNYSLTGDTLTTVGAPIGTRMMCAPRVMAQETRYTQLLQRVTSVTMDIDGTLRAATGDGRAIRFRKSESGTGN